MTAAHRAARHTLAAAAAAGGEPGVLLRFGELTLKRRKRPMFVAALERNLRQATTEIGPLDVRHRGSTFLVFAPRERLQEVIQTTLELPGLSVVQPALVVGPSVQAAARAAVALVRASIEEGACAQAPFAVRARRRDKTFPTRSNEIASIVGAEIQRELGLPVDLSRPALAVHVDALVNEMFVSVDRLRGAGGLPVGTSGRALVLLSGGIDSPVAAYRMMKRGLRCDFVHFSGQPLTGPESAYKAFALVARLDRFQRGSRLFVVPFGLAQRLLANSGAGRLQVLAQRRLMVRVANAIARREGCEALVTGDSLGQVASQTLRNLEVVETASSLPVLRPLLDRDKEEIIAEAERLGTYEVSILPDEDCCTLLAPRRAVTWADPDRLVEIEHRLDVEAVVAELADKARALRPRLEKPPAPHPDLVPAA